MRVLGYVRVSTEEQSSSGAGLQAQRQAIVAECERRGWHLVEVIEDAGFSAKDMKRPGVQEALRVLEAGEATALVGAASPASSTRSASCTPGRFMSFALNPASSITSTRCQPRRSHSATIACRWASSPAPLLDCSSVLTRT